MEAFVTSLKKGKNKYIGLAKKLNKNSESSLRLPIKSFHAGLAQHIIRIDHDRAIL